MNNKINKDSEDNKVEEKSSLSIWWLILIGIIALALALTAIGLYLDNFPITFSKSHEKWGQFGDFIGGTINPIFGFAGFIALLITIYIQSRELGYTRVEFEKSNALHEKQNDAAENQSNDNFFFHLIEIHKQNVNDLRIFQPDSANIPLSGNVCFESYEQSLSKESDTIGFKVESIDSKITEETAKRIIKSKMEKFLKNPIRNSEHKHNISSSIEPYLKHSVRVFKFIDEIKDLEIKYSYLETFKSHFTTLELHILMQYVIHIGEQVVKELIEEFGFLSPMSSDTSILFNEDLKIAYNSKAFKESIRKHSGQAKGKRA